MSSETNIPDFFTPIADNIRSKKNYYVRNLTQLCAYFNYIYRNYQPPVAVANDAYGGLQKSFEYMLDNPDQYWYVICKGHGTRSRWDGWWIGQIATTGTPYLDGSIVKSTSGTMEVTNVWGISKEEDRYWGPNPVSYDDPMVPNGDISGNWTDGSKSLSDNYFHTIDVFEARQLKDLLITDYNPTYKKLYSPVNMANDILTI